MAFLSGEFIAVPDSAKNQVVYKWPNLRIRKFSKAIVEQDEQAVFMNAGQYVGTMGPGRHQINADELPGLGILLDRVTGGNEYRAELYFVPTRELVGRKFGGRIDEVQDPVSKLIVTLGLFGEYAFRVSDPVKLLTNLTGTVNLGDEEEIVNWINEQILKYFRQVITTQVASGQWPIIGLSARTSAIESSVRETGNGELAQYGLEVTKFGNLNINLSDDDRETLKKLSKDTAYVGLAGGFREYAQGEAMLGMGEGLAQGGGADGAAGMFIGAGLGGQVAAPLPPTAPAGGGLADVGGYGAPEAPAAPAPAAVPSQDDLTSKLIKLAELHSQGVLTDEEFAAAKAKLLT